LRNNIPPKINSQNLNGERKKAITGSVSNSFLKKKILRENIIKRDYN